MHSNKNSNYIALVIIAFNHHAQLNRSIYYILVYTFICAFPILLDYNLWLYYLALHYFLTRGCDYLISRYRDTLNVLITEYRLSNTQLYPPVKTRNGHLTSRAILSPRLLCLQSKLRILILEWNHQIPSQATAKNLKHTRRNTVYIYKPIRKEKINVT
jgi:hypothetical protein